MKAANTATITLLSIGIDSDVAVYEQPDGKVSVEWDAEKSGDLNIVDTENMGEAVLLINLAANFNLSVDSLSIKPS